VVTNSVEEVDPRNVGVVVVDVWNWHWCKTSTARVGALVPRMNRVLSAARGMGMTVFLCPTDVADNYVGTPQVESALAAPLLPMPAGTPLQCPAAPDGGGCTCGRERCQGNYGWDAMHPDLVIGVADLMPNDAHLLYSLCQQRGITHLIYVGVHTQVCLLGKSVGLRAMTEAGFRCVLARDLTDAHGLYDPVKGITPDDFTTNVVAHFEKHLSPTINFVEDLDRAGLWNPDWIVDPVRVAPWGTAARPHLFEEDLTVTITNPWHSRAELRYTLDGSDPTPRSPRYEHPLVLKQTTRLRVAGFEQGRRVNLDADCQFARLGATPPAPDVFLSDVPPRRAVGMGHSPAYDDHRFSPGVNPPRMDLANGGQPLRLRGKNYAKGIGVHAPCQLIYDLKPEYDRFVALAGIDESMLSVASGSNLAMHPSVVFKVFIDGKEMASSPMMRISFDPWRFDVKIPRGSKRISIVATNGGDGNREDRAEWVEAGFVWAANRDGGAAKTE
jgi:nicotinamidase-related amidase